MAMQITTRRSNNESRSKGRAETHSLINTLKYSVVKTKLEIQADCAGITRHRLTDEPKRDCDDINENQRR
jgi:hypothetical protein